MLMNNGRGVSQNLTHLLLVFWYITLFPQWVRIFSLHPHMWKHLMRYVSSSNCSVAGSFAFPPTPHFSSLSLPFYCQITRLIGAPGSCFEVGGIWLPPSLLWLFPTFSPLWLCLPLSGQNWPLLCLHFLSAACLFRSGPQIGSPKATFSHRHA